MKIDFLCNYVANGWSPNERFLAGTEDSIVQWAERLQGRGHKVMVFLNLPQGEYLDELNGVQYRPRDTFKGGADVTINVKSSEVLPTGKTLYFTNETNASALDLSAYDAVVWPSQWCIDNIPVNNPKTVALPHGFDREAIYPGKKIPKQCFYASSPDRGLQTLLEAWPQVMAAHPDATLVVTYGVSGVNMPGVIALGACDEDTMNEVYNTSDVWCHPASGGELFCITGIKAQVAGCVPVIIPTMALAETVKFGVFSTGKDYAADLIDLLGDEEAKQDIRFRLSMERFADWETSTDQLEKLVKSCYTGSI